MNILRSKIITFLIIFAVILGITFGVYFQPAPARTYPNITPFALYYLRMDYTVKSNGTATLDSIAPTVIWFAGHAENNTYTVVIGERNGIAPIIQYSELNLFTLETNSTEHFLWWIPPGLPTGTPINMSSNTGVIVGQTELSVQQFVRNTNVVFYSGSDRTIVAYYDVNSGFLVQLAISEGGQMHVYQLLSALGVSLGVSNYYYARVIFLVLFVPSLVIFLLTFPWPWKKWSRSLHKTLRQKI